MVHRFFLNLPALCGLCLALTSGLGTAADTGSPGIHLLDAMQSALVQDPQIALQTREVESARGRALTEAGAFDARFTTAVARGVEQTPVRSTLPGPTQFERMVTHRVTAEASLQERLRSGIEFGPSIRVTRLDDNFSPDAPENRAEVNFSVRVPIAKGRGITDTGAEESASRIGVEASRYFWRHTVSARLTHAAAAYWAYVAAAERTAILRRSETQASELFEKTKGLVAAREVPAVELDQLAANLDDKSAGRIRSEQELLETQHDLGLAMGLAFEQFSTLGPPETSFPPTGEAAALSGSPAALTTAALQRREDLRAARLDQESALTLREASRRRLKPQVDLLLQAGYGGVDGGSEARRFFSSFYENVEGLNAYGGVSFEFPPANRAARGRALQHEAAFQQSVIRAAELERAIRSAVLVAWERVRNSQLELLKTQTASSEYERAVRNEQQKRQLGLATFTDVLAVEDRLIGAALARINAHQSYATAITRLRHETGMLLDGTESSGSVRLENLTTVPREPFPPLPTPPP